MFEIYLYRPDIPGDTTGVSLTLPATPYEMLDTLEKARITDTGVTYSVDFIACELDHKWQLRLPLRSFIAPDTNIHELNHLTHRLAGLDKGQLDCFEGMTMMDAIKTGYSPIPLERLINMTHSMEDCHVVYEAHDDTSLGKFYVDNDFPVIPPDLPEILYDMLDYESIGRKTRMGEGAESLCGGVFTPNGYVCANALKSAGEIADHYHSGDAIPQEKPQYTIMLEVCIAHSCKGYFDDTAQDSNFSEFPMLPADDGIIDRAVAQVEATSVEECSIRAVNRLYLTGQVLVEQVK